MLYFTATTKQPTHFSSGLSAQSSFKFEETKQDATSSKALPLVVASCGSLLVTVLISDFLLGVSLLSCCDALLASLLPGALLVASISISSTPVAFGRLLVDLLEKKKQYYSTSTTF